MGIMSKSNRLPERPKPPSWTEITEDVTSAQFNDVVFSLGQDYLASVSTATTPSSAQDSSLHTSEVESSNADTGLPDPDRVKSSKTKVLNLIDSYTQLTDSLGNLHDQYERLKLMRQELSRSVSELQVLAQDISADTQDKTDGSVAEKSLSKGKQKKKKKIILLVKINCKQRYIRLFLQIL